MKTILVPVEQHGIMHNVLDAAIVLADTFGSYVEGVAVSVDLPDVPVMDIAVGIPSVWDPELRREMAEASRKLFESHFMAKGWPKADHALHGGRWHWHPTDALSDSMIGAEGRCFDIIVVGRPNYRERNPRLATFESALFDSGRPVLVIPKEPVLTLTNHVVIAWNGSSETARAVGLAKPILRQAKRVTVLGIEGWGVEGPSASELAGMLQRSDIPASVKLLGKTNEDYGAVALRAAAELGCDLLIKGAYTQSRLRQMIFGGATNTILNEATLPVLFAH